MDENNNVNENSGVDKKALEKQHTEQNTKKALQVAEKGAATYFAGPEGAAAVNALHNAPVVGKALNKVEDKAVEKLGKNKNIANLANKLGDSGVTDAADKGLDAVGAAGGGGAAAGASGAAKAGGATAGASSSATSAAKGINDGLGKLPAGLNGSGGSNSPNGPGGGFGGGDDELSPSQRTVQAVKKTGKILKMISPALPFIGGAIVTILVVVMVMAEIMVIRDKIVGVINEVLKTEQRLTNFVTGDGWRTEDEAFFYKLKVAYNDFKSTTNSDKPLDIPLIAATIHYSKVTDMNNWDGAEGEHEDDIGKNEDNYSDSEDTGIGSSIVETYKTWSFYQMANVKLGNYTLTPGQRGLLGHLVHTEIEWHKICILDAPAKWAEFFSDLFGFKSLQENLELNDGKVGSALLDEISQFLQLSPIGMITGFADLFKDIQAFADQDSSALEWWSANFVYEAREFIEYLSGNFNDERLVNTPYSYYNNLEGSGTKVDGTSVGKPAQSVYDESQNYSSASTGKTTDDDGTCILNFPYPKVVRSMDYKGYYRYLVNVYIPLTYYRGLEVDKDYSFLEVVQTANAIFDQKYLYEYLVGEDTQNLASGCDYNFSGSSSTTVSVDKNMIDNLYVNVMSGSCGSVKNCTNIEETVSLKDYVIGVVYREIGASIKDNAEYLKANIIAAKSFTVGRRTASQSGDKYYINMINSTNDQVYCSVTKGCMEASSNKKPAPSAELLEYLGKLYDEVYNDFLYNSSSSSFTGYYRAKESQCIGSDIAGACLGQNESQEMGDAGKKYEAILGYFYVDPIGMVDISTGNFSVGVMQCISSGLKLGTDGYYMRTTKPDPTNIYFNPPYVSNSNRGQCVWYVKGRAQEIIANSIADASKKETAKNAIQATNGNGNQWFTEELQKVFGSSTDYRLPKVGSIAVYTWTDSHCAQYWGGTCRENYGHSLIVEEVNGNNVTTSEGYTKCSTGSPGWECPIFFNGHYTIEQMKDLGGNYKFIGYIYLLD